MSLLAIKEHMQQVKIASLSSLCLHFCKDQETLRPQLMHWIRKGKLKKCLKEADCGTKCFKCQVVTTELYEWQESADICA